MHPLGAPPWATGPPVSLHVDVDRVRRALATAPPPVSVSLTGASVVGRAGVLVPVFDDGGEAWMVLTRRAPTLRSHAGDVAFPGGRQDPGEDIVTTALREAEEEIGLDPATVTVVGELDRTVTITGIEMVPVVGLLPGLPTRLRPSPHEVDAVLLVRIGELLIADHYRGERWGEDGDRQMHEFDLEGDTIWGATGRILHRFLELVTGV